MSARLHPKPSEVIAAKLQIGLEREDKTSRHVIVCYGFIRRCLYVFLRQLKLGDFSATVKVSEQLKSALPKFPRTGSQARGSQEQVPKQGFKKRFPRTGPQPRFSRTGSQARFQKIGSQQDSQEQVPKGFKEQLRNRFPSKGSEEQVSKKRRPGKVPKARFPRKVRRIGKRELFPDKGFQARFPFHCGTAVPFFISFISKRPTKLNRYTSDDLCVSSHLRPSSSYYVGTKIS